MIIEASKRVYFTVIIRKEIRSEVALKKNVYSSPAALQQFSYKAFSYFKHFQKLLLLCLAVGILQMVIHVIQC